MKKEGKKNGHKAWLIAVLCFAGMVVTGFVLLVTLGLRGSGTGTGKAEPGAEKRLQSYLEQGEAESATDATAASSTIGAELEEAIASRANVTVDYATDTEVNLTITAPDVAALLQELRKTSGSSESLLAALESGNYTQKVTRLTTEIDADGRPLEAWDFLDAMYGGLLSYLNELAAELGEVQE